MENPRFSKALRTKLVDGVVYVDLEQLTQLVFDVANETTITATQMRDPALGIMALGVTTIGKGMDEALTLHKEAHGLMDQPKPCSVSKPHPGHVRLLNRKPVRCPGVDDNG